MLVVLPVEVAEGGAGSSVVPGGAVSGGAGWVVVDVVEVVEVVDVPSVWLPTDPSKAVIMSKETKIKGAIIFDTISENQI